MKCCICGKDIKGHGNNPWPLCKQPNTKCCDNCNVKVVYKRMTMADKKVMEESK